MMANAIISEQLVARVLRIFEAETPFSRDSVYCEIQDDFQLLFISISIDEFPEVETLSMSKHVAQILNGLVPKRSEDYSWVVGFKRGAEIVDSCFGGNLAAPSWGV